MAIVGVQRSYYKKFKFIVEIAGIAYAGFQDCKGLEIEVTPIEHWEGGSLVADKSPGRVKIPDVVLTRGATNDLDLWAWMQQVVAAESMVAEPDHIRTLDIVQQDRRGVELRRWTLVGAWPTKFKPGEWDNNEDGNLVEEITLCYRYPTLGGDTSP